MHQIFFWPCCAGLSYFQQHQISVNLGNTEKPKAASSSDQYSQSRINYASSKYSQVKPKSTLDKCNQFHFTNDRDMPLHFIWCLEPQSQSIPIWQIQATPVHISTSGHVCAVFSFCQLTIADVHSLYHYKYRLQPSLSISNAA